MIETHLLGGRTNRFAVFDYIDCGHRRPHQEAAARE